MQVPKNKTDFLKLCEEAGVSLPYAADTAVLGEKIRVQGLTVPNRIAYQAMEGCDSTASGSPDELTKRRYLRFAAGGPGVIWYEATAVMQEGRANPRQSFMTPDNVGDFAAMVNDIKSTCMRENGYEPVVICQLTHSGRYSKPTGTPAPLIAYNDPVFEKDKPIPADRIVTDEYLDRVGEALVNSTALAKQAGFDGVDIKSCHRYLLCELLSAFTRPGKYGGDYENRTRLLKTAVRGAMAMATDRFVISTRINLYDGFEYPWGFGVKEGEGITPDWSEAKRLMRELAAMGMPMFDFTMGNPYFNPHVNRPYASGGYEPPEHPMQGVARMLEGIREVAAVVPDTPVICSGLSFLGTEAGRVAAGCIREGWFAMAGFGRATLANPDIAKNILQNGQTDLDKLCLACGKCTEIMRQPGGTPGCAMRDHEVYTPIYQKLVLKKNN